jgi:GPH family glycoside/pentoside/hexuronide:cation symporter
MVKIAQRLSRKERFVYFLGAIPLTFMAGIFGLLYIYYFKEILKLDQSLFVAGQVIYMFVNAFNDPLLGQMSDRTNVKKWGSRRLVYIKWGGIIWGLVFFGMWFPWSYTNQTIIFIHYVLSICAFDMCLTLVILCWMALLPEITENLHERNKIQYAISIFGSFSAIFVLMAQALIKIENGLFYFQIVAGICGLSSMLIYYIIGRSLKERPELYQFEPIPPLFTSIKETLKSKAFRSYVGYSFFNSVNNTYGFAFIYAFIYIFGPNPFDPMLLVYYFLITTPINWISQAIFMMVAKKVDMKKLIVIFRALGMASNFVTYYLLMGPIGVVISLPQIAFKSAIGGFNLFNYPMLMIAIDEDEIVHGSRREGMFLGVNAFFQKFAESLGPILVSTLLYSVYGFVDEAVTQTPYAMMGIALIWYIIGGLSELASLLFISRYPLYGEKLTILREKLLQLHKEKEYRYKTQI